MIAKSSSMERNHMTVVTSEGITLEDYNKKVQLAMSLSQRVANYLIKRKSKNVSNTTSDIDMLRVKFFSC